MYTIRCAQLATIILTVDHKWPKNYVRVLEMERSAEIDTPRSGVSFEENAILRSRGWGETEPS